jgi:P-type conjugative transfer protein TrbJ
MEETMLSQYQWIAKGAFVLTLAGPGALAPAYAVIPVIDGANLTQTIVSATENVAQTLKQIEQYRTQLQQYENMLQNTAAPTAYVWDQAVTTMNRLRGAIDTLNYYKNQTGSLDAYLGKFQDVAYYRGSPCFNVGCSKAEWETMNRNAVQLGSEAQKRANDAMFRGLDRQQDAIEADARQLERLQSGAQGVNGQVQAIGFANQLASQQANQLLQIRALLIAQQNAEATRAQTIADQEARTRAADERALKGKYIPSIRKAY